MSACGGQSARAPTVSAQPSVVGRASQPDGDPALATARRLFPTAFGFPLAPEDRPKDAQVTIYVPVTESVQRLPPDACLNAVGQPGVTHDVFTALSITSEGTPPFSFKVMAPLLFRDRRAGYVLAAPDGATGTFDGVQGEPDEGFNPSDPSGGLHLDRLVLIEPSGQHRQGAASIHFDEGGLVQVCFDDEALRASECFEEARAAEPGSPPFLYDLTRCSAGCEAWCPGGVKELEDCSRPPAPQCVNGEQRLFFAGQDVGKLCQYEEWDLSCAKGCSDGRCQGGSPALRWSAKTPTESGPAIWLGPDTPAVLGDENLVAFTKTGQVLWQEEVPPSFFFRPVASTDGGVLLLGSRGEVWKVRSGTSFRVTLPAQPSSSGGLALAGDTVHVALGSKYFALDARQGRVLGSVELGADVVGVPVVSPAKTVAIATSRELVIVDSTGKETSRVALRGKPVGKPVFTAQGELLLVTTEGELWLGAPSNLRRLAAVGAFVRLGPTLTPDSGVLIVTEDKPHDGVGTLHKLALADGREAWRVALAAGPHEPVVDARGVWVVDSSGLVALDAKGERRWLLDLRGNDAFSPPLLGSDGTLYLRTFRRFSALALE